MRETPTHPSIHTIASWSHTVIWCIEFAQIKEFKKDLRTEWPQADHYAKCGKTSNHNVWVRCQLALHVCMYVHMSTNSAPNNVRTLDVFWSISGNSWTNFFCSGKLSAQRKRSSPSYSVIALDAPTSDSPAKKHSVQKKTVEKWIMESNKNLNTSVWLKFETAAEDCHHVATLKCTVCSRFWERLQPVKNYRLAFIEGTSNIRTSSFKDHAETDMHKQAMGFSLKRRSRAGLVIMHKSGGCWLSLPWMLLLPQRLSESSKRRTW